MATRKKEPVAISRRELAGIKNAVFSRKGKKEEAPTQSHVGWSMLYAGKGGKIEKVTDPKKVTVAMKKMDISKMGNPTFTWRTVGKLRCPKCGRVTMAVYDPKNPVSCVKCLIAALETVPVMEPVIKKGVPMVSQITIEYAQKKDGKNKKGK